MNNFFRFFFVIAILLTGFSWAQLPGLVWGKSLNTKNFTPGYYYPEIKSPISSGSDGSGNIYFTSHIADTIDFDPSLSTYTLCSTNDSLDIVVAKYLANGNFGWAFKLASPNIDLVSDMKVDITGNVYLVGKITQPVDFDPSPGSAVLTPSSSTGFVAKYDAAGSYQWAFLIKSSQTSTSNPNPSFFHNKEAVSLSLDNLNNIYICGQVSNGVFDFNPTSATNTVNALSGDKGFIVKYDQGGNFIWLTEFGSNFGQRDLNINSSNELIFTGGFFGSQDFNPNGPPSVLNTGSSIVAHPFIAKYNTNNCQLLWVKELMANEAAIYEHAISPNGDISTYGIFKNNLDLDPGPSTFNISEPNFGSYFISRYDGNGNFLWGFKNDTTLYIEDLVCETVNGDVITTGSVFYPTDFDPSASTFLLNPVTDSKGYTHQGFIAKYNGTGSFNTAFINNTLNFELALTPANDLYCLGTLQGIIDMDPTAISYTVSSNSYFSAFYYNDYSVCKYNGLISTVSDRPKTSDLMVYPNPTADMLILKSKDIMQSVQIRDVLGNLVSKISPDQNEARGNLTGLPAGIYIISVDYSDHTEIRKLILE